MPNYWVIAPYDYAYPDIWQRVWQFNLQVGFISIGWRDIKNVSTLSDQEIYELHRRAWPQAKERGASADSKVLRKFWHDIAEGDIVVARRGRKCIAAIGTVKSKPYYDPKKAKSSFAPDLPYPNHLDIKWDDEPRDVQFAKQVFGMQTVHSITRQALEELLERKQKSKGSTYPDDVTNDDDYIEGGRKSVIVNAYERSPAARSACLKEHGYHCAVCDMLFADVYGEIGINFIHVHHNNPIAARKKEYRVNPTRDLTPVCPNCHAMLHSSDPPLTIMALRRIVKQNSE